jgi:DnaJ-class molecular chaperone
MQTSSTNTKIIICEKCRGTGVVHKSELEDYHRGEYREWDEICPTCHGAGRLEELTTVTIKPYVPDGILLGVGDDK